MARYGSAGKMHVANLVLRIEREVHRRWECWGMASSRISVFRRGRAKNLPYYGDLQEITLGVRLSHLPSSLAQSCLTIGHLRLGRVILVGVRCDAPNDALSSKLSCSSCCFTPDTTAVGRACLLLLGWQYTGQSVSAYYGSAMAYLGDIKLGGMAALTWCKPKSRGGQWMRSKLIITPNLRGACHCMPHPCPLCDLVPIWYVRPTESPRKVRWRRREWAAEGVAYRVRLIMPCTDPAIRV